jgi:phosphatidylserine/phosphatidylglycerophosphate/cardiolipin synthase-like enzyme
MQSYAKRWELIEGAQQTLHMVSFSFMKDDTTRRLADLSAEKVRQGVEVKIIVDDAALFTTFSRGILKKMAKAGVEVLTYDSPLRYLTLAGAHGHPFRKAARDVRLAVKRRFHEKYLVVDGREAVLGGMNWGTKYALGGTDVKWWRDTDVHLTGPVVADIQRRFLNDVFVYRAQNEAYRRRRERGFDGDAFAKQARLAASQFMEEHQATYFPTLAPAGAERIRYVGHKPWDEEALPLTNAALHLVRSAERTIYWGCHGVRPPRIMAENLADAAARGVEVHLITNSKRSSRSLMGNGLMGWMWWECSHYFRWLVDHGIHVHQWQLPGAFHSKNMVVDDAVAAVGSYNVANGSAFHHTESAVIVTGGSFPLAVRNQFERDLANCREVTADSAKKPFVPLPLFDPWRRPLHERNLLVARSEWPAGVAADIAAGRIVWKYSDKPRASVAGGPP